MEKLNAQHIRSLLPDGITLGGKLHCLDRVGSTNVFLKELAEEGAPHGTVVMANEQTTGKGSKGRRFESAADAGLYFSLLLRPNCDLADTVALTPWTAVAVAGAISACCGARPDIKWVNDLLLNGRKLCGILTELSIKPDGALDYAIIGIGINLTQTRADFAALELGEIATSLAAEGFAGVSRNALAAALITALDRMAAQFPREKESWLERYRSGCISTGRAVRVIRGDQSRAAQSLTVEDDFSLRVRYEDGTEESVNAGDVSIRGMMGQY
jgi:BirA family biotin operon repressor/biotin-[acetyl-CoA-carboxylase] ligase